LFEGEKSATWIGKKNISLPSVFLWKKLWITSGKQASKFVFSLLSSLFYSDKRNNYFIYQLDTILKYAGAGESSTCGS
jgi:hypothetical protein